MRASLTPAVPPFSEIVARLRELEGQPSPGTELRVAWLRNVVLDGVRPYVCYLGNQSGWRVESYFGGFDNVVQEVLDGSSGLYSFAPDFVVVCLALEPLAPRLLAEFAGLTAEEAAGEVARVFDHISTVVTELRRRTRAVVLLHTFESPVRPSYGILDAQDSGKQLHSIRRLNSRLVDLARSTEGVYLVDLDLLRSALGAEAWTDRRYWHLARAPFSRDACLLLAAEYLKFFRALRGKSKKCLVLDCDNTLWGGIVGEDGLAGIRIGTTFPGSAFLAFQRAILDCYHRGVLLAICSRNNEADVLEVLRSHPDMLLREEHFVARRINWTTKAASLKEIASELRIGLESLVFMDDSAYEIEMVRSLLPEVTSVQLPKQPELFADCLRAGAWFDTLLVAEEDRVRSAMIQADRKRDQVRREMGGVSLEQYLCSLEMTVCLGPPTEVQVSRVAQLTQRTNQFNLTTRRYAEADIRSMLASASTGLLAISLRDRFGDLGLVGAAVLANAEGIVRIDTFVLSCRALGRGVEDVLLAGCVHWARAQGARHLVGEYIRSAKNGLVADFYSTRGFAPMTSSGAARYILEIADSSPGFPGHFRAIEVTGSTPLSADRGLGDDS
jgi:FkbH-like protein